MLKPSAKIARLEAGRLLFVDQSDQKLCAGARQVTVFQRSDATSSVIEIPAAKPDTCRRRMNSASPPATSPPAGEVD